MTTSTSFAAANNRKLANQIAAAERYLCGYIYGGTTVRLDAPGFAPDQLRQTMFGYRAPDVPSQTERAHNKRVLAAAPLGSKVNFRTSLSGGNASECWEKVGPCRWDRIEWSEDAQDGSGAFWDAQGYHEWGPLDENREEPEDAWDDYCQDEEVDDRDLDLDDWEERKRARLALEQEY